jgi:hypothetical protein
MTEPQPDRPPRALTFAESIELALGLALGLAWIGYRFGWDLLAPAAALLLVVSALWGRRIAR